MQLQLALVIAFNRFELELFSKLETSYPRGQVIASRRIQLRK